MATNYTNEEFLKGLIDQDNNILNHIYNEIGPIVLNYIKSKGGSDDEANDIFQEGLVSVYINAKSGKYKPQDSTKFSSYLIQICKYKWYDVLKSSHKSKGDALNIDIEDSSDIHLAIENEEKYTVLHRLIEQLGVQCKNILQKFYWSSDSIQEISKALKMTPASVKNGKYRCMQKLKEAAKNNDYLK